MWPLGNATEIVKFTLLPNLVRAVCRDPVTVKHRLTKNAYQFKITVIFFCQNR